MTRRDRINSQKETSRNNAQWREFIKFTQHVSCPTTLIWSRLNERTAVEKLWALVPRKAKNYCSQSNLLLLRTRKTSINKQFVFETQHIETLAPIGQSHKDNAVEKKQGQPPSSKAFIPTWNPSPTFSKQSAKVGDKQAKHRPYAVHFTGLYLHWFPMPALKRYLCRDTLEAVVFRLPCEWDFRSTIWKKQTFHVKKIKYTTKVDPNESPQNLVECSLVFAMFN